MGEKIKKTLLIILLLLLIVISSISIAYILNKREIVSIPDNPVFDIINNYTEEESTEEESDTDNNVADETESEPETFAEDVTVWPEQISEIFPEFTFGTINHATEMAPSDRYELAWIVEFTNVSGTDVISYLTGLEGEGWTVLDEVTTDLWVINSATKDDYEVSLMLKIEDNSLNLELISK